MPIQAKNAVLEIRRGLGQFGYMMRSYSGSVIYHDQSHDNSSFRHIVEALDLSDINQCLYRIDQEERDDGYGFGTYNVPNHGPLVYCGLRGRRFVLMRYLNTWFSNRKFLAIIDSVHPVQY